MPMEANKDNRHAYNGKLKPYATELRNNGTKAEACLWKYVLKNRLMRNYQFLRQRSVLNYIADFMCKDLMLIIEVDGDYHYTEEQRKRDQYRTDQLTQAGFTVIRFDNDLVLRFINVVRSDIEDEIVKIEQQRGLETPAPRIRRPRNSKSDS